MGGSNKRKCDESRRTSRKARKAKDSLCPQRPKPAAVWTLDERCRLVEGLDSKFGAFSDLIAKHVGSKQVSDVSNYSRYYQLLETGANYPEFMGNAAIDTWIDLAEKTIRSGDKQAAECIPQIMTVAALEPKHDKDVNPSDSPNFSNIYNYLAIILRGGEPPDLPACDAEVVLNLLDDLIEQFANSYTMLQREFLHDAFRELSGKGDSNDNTPMMVSDNVQESQTQKEPKKFSSLNPLNVPALLLDFKKKKPIVLDFSTCWRTKV